ATSRDMEPAALQSVADAEGLIRPEVAKSAHLIDRIAYVDEILDELRTATGVKNPKQSFRQNAPADYSRMHPTANLAARRPQEGSEVPTPGPGQKIAIVYTEGTIVDGTGTGDDTVWSDKAARDLREVRRDDSVRAVVLRVNSPGGSVSASEAIQREV